MSAMELGDFLLARITEDEAAAVRSCGQEHPGADIYCGPGGHPDPRRLAECDARRRIVEEIRSYDGDGWQLPLSIPRLLALPYADHPDYRAEWKP